jgi:hypothetical protein
MDSTLVMTGRLEEFQLADVLQVVGFSPQYTAVELRYRDGALHGTNMVKAGRVLRAEQGGVQGKPAFYRMFTPKTHVFVVSRRPEPPEFPPPLGSLASLLMEADGQTR